MRRNYFKTIALLSLILACLGCSKKKEQAKSPLLNVSGTIEIDPDLLKYARASDTVFVIARPATGGPPVAVERLQGKNYPLIFKLTEKNIMIHQNTLDFPLNLTVRVDKDGNAMTKDPGDLAGAYEKNPVSLHAENITLRIQEILK